ncbi:S53 family peptidase [Mucilaginibacter arboris]|uniref:S8 family serine peptidase n=1 Tax=Mucilaginibacter arboris TaxID=2682090 RepID=A0A7K1SU49_9SPHI|nr:S53 family peptidase [Mucilaginibacter arboris]MVN20787.1 S8 family serine peptidase [Mucilaginibacter arboris]
MKTQQKVALKGSYRMAPEKTELKKVDPEKFIEVTVRIRRKKSIDEALASGQTISREDYEKEFGASQEDADAVETYAQEHHLTTVEVHLARRSVILKGKISDFAEAFAVDLHGIESEPGVQTRIRTGDIHVPTNLEAIITGVFGFDERPAARPMFQIYKQENKIVDHAAAPSAYTADQLAKIYGFPTGVTGKGQSIAIIELGGGYKTVDITNYFKSLGIKKPTVKAVSVDGGKNAPTTPDSADGEVLLDIEVAGAVAPEATIVVYFAPNTDQGFLDAITKAVHDTTNKPSVVSISWGSAEVNWTQQAMTNFNESFKAAALLGVTICVAAGDAGSSDGVTDGKVHVDFPASSPYALACGGTKLTTDGSNKITSETVWHAASDSATGGGVSDFFPLPDYQANAKIPVSLNTNFKGRGLPDVAGDADPSTGYKVLVDGQQYVIGGTSAVAPLMAGLLALINQQKGKPVGFINPTLYSTPNLCRDITSGDNKTTQTKTGYAAGKGWDACTGWGVLSKLP